MDQPRAHPVFVTLPEPLRDRLQAAADARGETVEVLVENLAERFLAETRPCLQREDVIRTLRADAARLHRRGIIRLWLFGSVARGEARADSDVDLFAEFDLNSGPSLVGLASLRADLSDLLGAPADLVDRAALHPAVREAAEREAVLVL